jgi:hypothetical protein
MDVVSVKIPPRSIFQPYACLCRKAFEEPSRAPRFDILRAGKRSDGPFIGPRRVTDTNQEAFFMLVGR